MLLKRRLKVLCKLYLWYRQSECDQGLHLLETRLSDSSRHPVINFDLSLHNLMRCGPRPTVIPSPAIPYFTLPKDNPKQNSNPKRKDNIHPMPPLSTFDDAPCCWCGDDDFGDDSDTLAVLPIEKPQRITFHKVVQIREIPDRSILTDDEADSLWYNASDFLRIKNDNLTILDKLSSGELCSENLITKGLERHTTVYINRRKTALEYAHEAVFGLQQHEAFEGCALPELMAELYEKNTDISRSEALERASMTYS